MVGAFKAGIDDVRLLDGDIGRDEEAVHRQNILSLMIRAVGVAAARHRILFVERRNQTHGKAVEGLIGDGLRPGVRLIRRTEILRRVAEQILVEVAARDAPVPLLILALHVAQQERELFGRDRPVGRVGRQVEVIEHQLPPAVHRDAADGVAAVEVKQFHETALHGQLHAPRRRNLRGRERQQTRA